MPDDELTEDRKTPEDPGDYEWLLTDDIMVTRLSVAPGATIKALCYNYYCTKAAILELDESRPKGQEVYTNGKFIDWGDDFPAILGILDAAQAVSPFQWLEMPADDEDGPDNPYRKMAAWAATQPADNIVYLMTCGHEYDSAIELLPGTDVPCSQHGLQKIASEFNGPNAS